MPVTNFTIPSIHDNIQLECRVHVPSKLPNGYRSTKWGAIVAHPYAPLGGSLDDHVISIAVKELLAQGIPTVTFNFRGAGNSQGHTSWTGAAEDDDYLSVVYFLIAFLEHFHVDDANCSRNEIHMILGGYSYGSMKAMNTSPDKELLSLRAWTQAKPELEAIKQAALKLAATSNLAYQISPARDVGEAMMDDPEQGTQDLRRRPGRPIVLKPHYLIISPLLPPISFLLNLGNPFKLPTSGVSTVLREHPALVVYGGRDSFTSAKRVTEWGWEISRLSSGRDFRHLEVEDADHFWKTDNAQQGLRDAIREWTADQLSRSHD